MPALYAEARERARRNHLEWRHLGYEANPDTGVRRPSPLAAKLAAELAAQLARRERVARQLDQGCRTS